MLHGGTGEATLLSDFGATVIAETLMGTERWRLAMTEFKQVSADKPELTARIATLIDDGERRNREMLLRLCLRAVLIRTRSEPR